MKVLFDTNVILDLLLDRSHIRKRLLYEAAKYAGVDCIVTRNLKDFKLAKLPVYLPSELESVSALSERK